MNESPTTLAAIIADGEAMRKRHRRQRKFDDGMMKVMFALLVPPLALFPSFWRM